jgi:predicted ribosomally synthesized peptide with nif11-like leader
MSVDEVVRFYRKVESDPTLQEKLKGLTASDKATAARELSRLAAQVGYYFEAALVEPFLSESRELSDEELQAVVGGQGAPQPLSPPVNVVYVAASLIFLPSIFGE